MKVNFRMIDCNKTDVYNNREYKYDNIKFILIFLVLFAHIIESVEKFDGLYLIIYSFHIPVFVFVSGYFAKGNKKSIIKSIIIYIIFETLYFLIYKFVLHEQITLNYFQPIWILWYIFALAIWNCLIFFIKKLNLTIKKVYIMIVITFLLSLICGYIDEFGYYLSLSRIIAFFPFFLLGYFSKNTNIKIVKKDDKNIRKYIVYLCIAIICIFYFISLSYIDKIWFYNSYSYANGGYSIIFRFFLSLFSLCMIFIFNNYVSSKKMLISYIGKNTLFIYLFHGIIIKLLNPYINNVLETNNVIISCVIAIIYTITMIIRY